MKVVALTVVLAQLATLRAFRHTKHSFNHDVEVDVQGKVQLGSDDAGYAKGSDLISKVLTSQSQVLEAEQPMVLSQWSETGRCPTAACCKQEEFLSNSSSTPSNHSGDVWVTMFAGWESCIQAPKFTPTVLEEHPVVASGWCMVWTTDTTDGRVHAQFIEGEKDSCMHGTAFRMSQKDFDDYEKSWLTDAVPQYKAAPMTVTAFDGTQLQAITLNHVKPMVLKEKAPDIEGYFELQFQEMRKRQYCPAYQNTIAEHYRELMNPKSDEISWLWDIGGRLLFLIPILACCIGTLYSKRQ